MADRVGLWGRVLGRGNRPQETKIISTEESHQLSEATKVMKREAALVSKSYGGKDIAFTQPLLPTTDIGGINPGYKEKPSVSGTRDLHKMLRYYSTNPLLQAIKGVRKNQVSMYAQPARDSDKGQGFEIAPRNRDGNPTEWQKRKVKEYEKFIMNMGYDDDPTRPDFYTFLREVIDDTLTYDQVNFENTFNPITKTLLHVKPVDPTTIYYRVDPDTHLIYQKGKRLVQVYENQVKHVFDSKEMAMAIRNPRTDILSGGYGLSELEVGLREFIAHENTESFNDRFFSHGGTTRGVLQIKTPQDQSRQAFDAFRREWNNSLAGINGSWKIPVISAEDVKFVNMTPQAQDMEFEKWLNYLINIISSIYGIDPAEIGFPNRGGATGTKSNSLNEGSSKQKSQESQNKGLQPLLKFVEVTINRYVMANLDGDYVFRFVGGDPETELDKIKKLGEEAKVYKTPDEIRAELGIKGKIPGGDIILNGVAVQRYGQIMQQQQLDYQKQKDRLQMITEQTNGSQPIQQVGGITYQDNQQGLAGNSDSVNGKDTQGPVGKDGQPKGNKVDNPNAGKQGGKKK